jgi:hypothetical protein
MARESGDVLVGDEPLEAQRRVLEPAVADQTDSFSDIVGDQAEANAGQGRERRGLERGAAGVAKQARFQVGLLLAGADLQVAQIVDQRRTGQSERARECRLTRQIGQRDAFPPAFALVGLLELPLRALQLVFAGNGTFRERRHRREWIGGDARIGGRAGSDRAGAQLPPRG